MSFYISDHPPCQCGLRRHFSLSFLSPFPSFLFLHRASLLSDVLALICSVLSGTREADLAVKANSPKDSVWSESLVSCQPVPAAEQCGFCWQPDCLRSSSPFSHVDSFWRCGASQSVDIQGGSLALINFSPQLLDASGSKRNQLRRKRALRLLLSPIRSASLISLRCIEAKADPHSDGRPNRLICGEKKEQSGPFSLLSHH